MATAGKLYVVATPIGNLDDITFRAVRVLKSVDLIAAEDTRHSHRLLAHLGIATPMTSYHEHNESTKAATLVEKLLGGESIALVSDAGTPGISDPGYRLVRAAQDAGIPVNAVPGPSAAVAALSASGLPTDRFTFHGFFPRKRADSVKLLHEAAAYGGTHVFFESPHRLAGTLSRITHHAPHAEVCLARELTKIHEENLRGAPQDLLDWCEGRTIKGECVLAIHFWPEQGEIAPEEPGRIRELVHDAMEREGLSRRDAVREVARQLNLPRNRVYAAATESP